MSSPLNLDTILSQGLQSMRPTEAKWEPFVERRKWPRVLARWPVYLSRKTDPHLLETVTRDMSSGGFYCAVPEPYLLGEPVECYIVIPTQVSYTRKEELCLRGRAKVVRLESLDPEGYGIACQLEDYTITSVPFRRPEKNDAGEAALNKLGKLS